MSKVGNLNDQIPNQEETEIEEEEDSNW